MTFRSLAPLERQWLWLPEFQARHLKLPYVHLPYVHLPYVQLPYVHLPYVHLPYVHLPYVHLKLPCVHLHLSFRLTTHLGKDYNRE